MNRLSLIKTLLISLLLVFGLAACQSDEPSALQRTLYVKTEGAYLPVYVRGNVASGKLLLILHGGPNGNGLEYAIGSYAAQLEKEMAVAYLDQRGQGMAQGKYPAGSVTIGQMAADVHQVIRVLKTVYAQHDPSVFLLGHSWGGMLGTAFLINPTYAAEIKGWIMANGAYDIPMLNRAAIARFKTVGAEQIALKNSVEKWEEMLDFVSKIDTTQPIDYDTSAELNSRGFAVEGFLKADGFINPGEGLGGTLRHLFFSPLNPLTSQVSGQRTANLLAQEIDRTAFTNRLPEIKTPTLLLYSRYDFVVPFELGRVAYTRMASPNKKLIEFTQSGHSPMDTEASKFAAEIIKFVKSL